MISGLCDCQAGLNRGPCKHKDAIAKYFNIAEFSVLPESDINIRALYHFIAHGTVCDDIWYRDLEASHTVTNIANFVENRMNKLGLSCVKLIKNLGFHKKRLVLELNLFEPMQASFDTLTGGWVAGWLAG